MSDFTRQKMSKQAAENRSILSHMCIGADSIKSMIEFDVKSTKSLPKWANNVSSSSQPANTQHSRLRVNELN